MIRAILGAAAAALWLTPVLALGEPVVWRDPDTGCGYYLTSQGGMTIRYKADGSIDCPVAPQSTGSTRGALDELSRELGRGLDTLRRELERLRRSPEERL